ncbi:hypothetical protein EV673_0675 [Limnobacter thiooxidans]|uniref:Uncharacterized protein n=1 Tax=Limnobacter thiooxidans TaxID=131080 RepID=A0AA86JKK2_9BURK|nr:hypothetical protein [Limnobacter sp.]MCZ8015257.1 hypothetical protein [Limnobacter sp.]RZS42341.1 hypothetical protein EV673_0675 [Limnobacter thiooxidans]BET26227.1 hypothetical protein RGQ30_17280 [Limnobacter thiooxidans]
MLQQNCATQLGQWLAGNENGSVYYCQTTNVVSLSLHYMTLRFEALAFRDLLGMMGFAQAEIQRIDQALNRPALSTQDRNCQGGALH